jgi:hypothetical protein
MAIRRSSIRGAKTHGAALTVTRFAVRADHLVYVAVANKSVSYLQGKSRILYIGTTKNGIDRIASSAAARARGMLRLHGVKSVEFFVFTCRARQNVKMWRKLERALLLTFKELYGEPPRFNTQGKNMVWVDEDEYFAIGRLRTIIRHYESL